VLLHCYFAKLRRDSAVLLTAHEHGGVSMLNACASLVALIVVTAFHIFRCCRRRQHLDDVCGDPQRRFGYNPLHHDSSPYSSTASSIKAAATAAAAAAAVAENTHSRLFERTQQQRRPHREQALVNAAHGGKAYNIVTGCTVPAALLPSAPERVCAWLGHPSQTTLERGRNMQGSLVA
jgi:hypothetical protein